MKNLKLLLAMIGLKPYVDRFQKMLGNQYYVVFQRYQKRKLVSSASMCRQNSLTLNCWLRTTFG